MFNKKYLNKKTVISSLFYFVAYMNIVIHENKVEGQFWGALCLISRIYRVSTFLTVTGLV